MPILPTIFEDDLIYQFAHLVKNAQQADPQFINDLLLKLLDARQLEWQGEQRLKQEQQAAQQAQQPNQNAQIQPGQQEQVNPSEKILNLPFPNEMPAFFDVYGLSDQIRAFERYVFRGPAAMQQYDTYGNILSQYRQAILNNIETFINTSSFPGIKIDQLNENADQALINRIDVQFDISRNGGKINNQDKGNRAAQAMQALDNICSSAEQYFNIMLRIIGESPFKQTVVAQMKSAHTLALLFSNLAAQYREWANHAANI